MSRETRVSVKRGGVQVAGLEREPVQIDSISLSVIAGSNGAIPHNSFMLYSLARVIDVLQSDTVTDLKTNLTYRVSGEPEHFDRDHTEVMITLPKVGTP
jgi:hypothetical protein